MDTLRALEEAIDGYPGCAVIVSHDRYFLDRVATHTLAFEDDGGVVSTGERRVCAHFVHSRSHMASALRIRSMRGHHTSVGFFTDQRGIACTKYEAP